MSHAGCRNHGPSRGQQHWGGAAPTCLRRVFAARAMLQSACRPRGRPRTGARDPPSFTRGRQLCLRCCKPAVRRPPPWRRPGAAPGQGHLPPLGRCPAARHAAQLHRRAHRLHLERPACDLLVRRCAGQRGDAVTRKGQSPCCMPTGTQMRLVGRARGPPADRGPAGTLPGRNKCGGAAYQVCPSNGKGGKSSRAEHPGCGRARHASAQ